jgi:phosphoribosyl-AMP cyclohydrolase
VLFSPAIFQHLNSAIGADMDIKNQDWVGEISFNSDGLIPVIAQDNDSHRVLMVAWMNEVAVKQTVATGIATYWSRSRSALWRKGESSGNEQHVQSVQLDCDADVLILNVIQIGGIACHTGRNSCFFRTLTPEGWQTTEPVLKDPGEMYPNA